MSVVIALAVECEDDRKGFEAWSRIATVAYSLVSDGCDVELQAGPVVVETETVEKDADE